MKNKAVRLFAAGAATTVTLTLLPLSGCGSGGGSSPINTSTTLSPSLPNTSASGLVPSAGPTPTPAPSVVSSAIPSTSKTGVTTRGSYDDPAAPRIDVSFTVIPDFTQNLVEYHIYRNDVIAARFTQQEVAATQSSQSSRFTYTDTGSATPFAYQQVIPDIPNRVSLITAQSEGIGPFSPTTPVVYRITLVFSRSEFGWYGEEEIGRSNTITPFR